MNNALTNNSLSVQEISAVSKTFFESSMFSDCKSAAQAMVKIMAGAEVGLPAFQSMSGIHIIAGKPVIGAGLIASKIKGSGKYDYRVTEQSNEKCSIDFYQGKEKIGTSEFTLEDAKKAQTKNIDKFPKNMLFARAISNGVKWYCPDVFAGPIYVPGEIVEDNQQTEDVPFEEVEGENFMAKEPFPDDIKTSIKDAKDVAALYIIHKNNPDLHANDEFNKMLSSRKAELRKTVAA